ncbi:hypothetical protein [Ferruginibacter sp. SUN106]|uniref:hypothetical protein n=1 Tax=Ferruginibacter sp. SUN106 TaxID=2978348 RepID=UPI003D369050
MKKYFLVFVILCYQNLFSQTSKQQSIDSSRFYINFMSTQYKPAIANIYISGGLPNVFSQTFYIPNNAFMWFRCDSANPCRVNVDGAYNELNALLANRQFNNGDSIIVNMDNKSIAVINRKKDK